MLGLKLHHVSKRGPRVIMPEPRQNEPSAVCIRPILTQFWYVNRDSIYLSLWLHHHWFKKYLVICSIPSYYINQCCSGVTVWWKFSMLSILYKPWKLPRLWTESGPPVYTVNIYLMTHWPVLAHYISEWTFPGPSSTEKQTSYNKICESLKAVRFKFNIFQIWQASW